MACLMCARVPRHTSLRNRPPGNERQPRTLRYETEGLRNFQMPRAEVAKPWFAIRSAAMRKLRNGPLRSGFQEGRVPERQDAFPDKCDFRHTTKYSRERIDGIREMTCFQMPSICAFVCFFRQTRKTKPIASEQMPCFPMDLVSTSIELSAIAKSQSDSPK